MSKVVLRYGLYSIVFLVVLSAISMVAVDDTGPLGELVGYLVMALSMIFVFFGMRQYRDRVNGGCLSFGQGLKVGLLIVLLPAIAFGLFDILYTRVINPTWYDTYTAKMMVKMDAAQKANFKKQMDLFRNPAVEFLLMAVSVLVVGFIATIISSLALMRKRTVVVPAETHSAAIS